MHNGFVQYYALCNLVHTMLIKPITTVWNTTTPTLYIVSDKCPPLTYGKLVHIFLGSPDIESDNYNKYIDKQKVSIFTLSCCESVT